MYASCVSFFSQKPCSTQLCGQDGQPSFPSHHCTIGTLATRNEGAGRDGDGAAAHGGCAYRGLGRHVRLARRAQLHERAALDQRHVGSKNVTQAAARAKRTKSKARKPPAAKFRGAPAATLALLPMLIMSAAETAGTTHQSAHLRTDRRTL